MRLPSADELLDMGRDDLKWVRARFVESRPEDGLPPEHFFDFLIILSAVQNMRDWSVLAEPGLTGLMLRDGEDDENELADAREIDRHSIEFHQDAVREFESLGGKEALQRLIDLNNANR